MFRVFGDHSGASAWQRLRQLLRGMGFRKTAGVLVAAIDDNYLKTFDWRYKVRTSGYVPLASTSFDPVRLRDATQYRPANAWGFRRLLRELALPRHLRFVDLGCGLGRICILAGEYGFRTVTGVDLAPELCAQAWENVAHCRAAASMRSRINILEMDALAYCANTDEDVFFMFCPFSSELLRQVLEKLIERSGQKPLTVIYSEKMMLAGSHTREISELGALRKVYDGGWFGQAFYVYEVP
jgi:SAM-dependent methyltransferase